MTEDNVQTKIEVLRDSNNSKLKELMSMGANVDPSPMIVQSVIDFLVAPEDLPKLELIFQNKLAEALEAAIIEVRKQYITSGVPTPAQQSSSSGLILP